MRSITREIGKKLCPVLWVNLWEEIQGRFWPGHWPNLGDTVKEHLKEVL